MTIEKKLIDDYRNYYFNRKELEICLGFDLDMDQLTSIKHKIELTANLPEELKPFLSRKTIQLKEAANIMAGYNPFHWSNKSKYLDDVQGYRASLWDAVDNNILVSKNLITHEDFGQEWRDDITLNKNEVTKWANKYNYNWLIPIDDETEDTNQNNSDLLSRITKLELELSEQKKINSESVYIPPLNIADTDNLEAENNQLKIDNKKLTEQLNNANKEIEELKKIVPILLGQYKSDDLLLLAIQSRDKYWSNYTDTDPNYKSLSAEQIRRGIKKEFNHLSDRELNAIEFVSCPINRKK